MLAPLDASATHSAHGSAHDVPHTRAHRQRALTGRAQARIAQLLRSAHVEIDGDAPTDLQVHNPRFYARVLEHGSLGLGEAYMDGWWDAEDLDGLLFLLLNARLDERLSGVEDIALFLRAKLVNLQRGRRAWEVGASHYDLGNDLFAAMLGKHMVYSCGYWKNAHNLDEAQHAKLDLVCRKLHLQPGMRVLDIGCGWGEALRYAAQTYGVSGVGVTISQEQAQYARELCAGLPVEILVQDYRALQGRFDRVWSIGMFEHVGAKNYRTYFDLQQRCLRDDGLALLHTIGSNVTTNHTDPWIEKYIFPNSMLPSAAQIGAAYENLCVLEDWHGFGPYYDYTLMAWLRNFERAWPQLRLSYGERFHRMWRFYLCSSAAVFRARRDQLWQIVFSPRGAPGGYAAVR